MTAKAGSKKFSERGARARQHNHALVALGRQVWHDDCTLETAIGMICEVAAETLGVERVNVWRVDEEHQVLRCIHAYSRSGQRHNPPGFDEVLPLDSDYGEQLVEVRVIDVVDVRDEEAVTASEEAMNAYLRRHGIHSLLDAPIRAEGRLFGVVCHEHVGSARMWTPEDYAFAGSIGDYVAVAYEIARRREIEDRLRYLERHDPQTDLPNRDHLLEVAHNALRPLHEGDTGLVVIHIHIDPPTSDMPGDADAFHGFLIDAAERLRGLVAEDAALARVREEGFAIIPHRHLREIEALELAERCLDALHLDDGSGGRDYANNATAGLAFSRDLAAPSADALLRNAENASLRARANGHGRCKVFNADRHRTLLDRMRVEQQVRDAFDENRLTLHYMPEVDLHSGRWRAAEALLRWRREDGVIVPAAEFISVTESSGLIVRLGRWVLLEACCTAVHWPEVDGARPLLRVNVSARQFEESGLASDVQNALAESGLPPERLCLELTETMLLRDRAAAAKALQRLRSLGVSVALDDFGTGYCSLGYLKQLPIDTIKIDRSFTAGLPNDRADLAIVKALVGLADSLDIDIVGEGVETQAQADCLRDCGIHAVQGYLYSPAIPNEVLIERYAAQGGG